MIIFSDHIEGLRFSELRGGLDDRGVVREFFRKSSAEENGHLTGSGGWPQINVTETQLGAIRGFHSEDMAKLVGVISGEAFGIWIDARRSSPTFGHLVTKHLEIGTQVYVPMGVLNGFQSLSSPSQYLYCFTEEWSASMSAISVNPLDPDIAAPWPLPANIDDRYRVSQKDADAQSWNDFLRSGA